MSADTTGVDADSAFDAEATKLAQDAASVSDTTDDVPAWALGTPPTAAVRPLFAFRRVR